MDNFLSLKFRVCVSHSSTLYINWSAKIHSIRGSCPIAIFSVQIRVNLVQGFVFFFLVEKTDEEHGYEKGYGDFLLVL